MKTTTSVLIKITAIFIVMINTANAANRFSIANGNWTATTIWSATSGGATCNCTPVKSDNIYINTNVTLDKNLTGGGQGITGSIQVNPGGNLNGGSTYSIEIKSGASFNVNGSLTVNNLTYFSGSVVTINSAGTVTVNGTFLNSTSSNAVTINGAKTVNGTFTNSASGVITGTGKITIVNGPATNGSSATIFGSSSSPCASFPCVLGNAALPIELAAFGAVRIDSGVEIKWATATETNNDYFTIERTNDLTMGYTQIGVVRGAGNSNIALSYTYSDKMPLKGGSYYRLRQTDFDGSTKTFDPVFVEGASNSGVKIYPNPSSDNKIYIKLNREDVNTTVIKVYDMNGSEVKTNLQTEENGSVMTIEINPDAVKVSRIFYVTVINGDKVQREKLVINN